MTTRPSPLTHSSTPLLHKTRSPTVLPSVVHSAPSPSLFAKSRHYYLLHRVAFRQRVVMLLLVPVEVVRPIRLFFQLALQLQQVLLAQSLRKRLVLLPKHTHV